MNTCSGRRPDPVEPHSENYILLSGGLFVLGVPCTLVGVVCTAAFALVILHQTFLESRSDPFLLLLVAFQSTVLLLVAFVPTIS